MIQIHRDMELTANIHLEDGSYWADVPELPGCFASGDTLDELFGSLREGVRLYLDDGEGPSADERQPLQLKTAILSDAPSV
jgi:predicted RNase H-like HicB family nuclease